MGTKVESQRRFEHETERKTPKGQTEIRMGRCHRRKEENQEERRMNFGMTEMDGETLLLDDPYRKTKRRRRKKRKVILL
jgi:hypothetical protein